MELKDLVIKIFQQINFKNSNNNVVNGNNNDNLSNNFLSDFSKVFNFMKRFDNLNNNLKIKKNQINKIFDEQQKENNGD